MLHANVNAHLRKLNPIELLYPSIQYVVCLYIATMDKHDAVQLNPVRFDGLMSCRAVHGHMAGQQQKQQQ